jgi:hypothetical protein
MLPNAFSGTRRIDATTRESFLGRIGGGILSTRLFDPLERWEMHRKVRRLSARLEREGGDTVFSADVCRGHFATHDVRILTAYRARCATYREALDGLS